MDIDMMERERKLAMSLKSLIATGTKLWLDSIEPELVKKNRVDLVYLALPMASQPRIRALLDGLRDTTASVYFVPDMFVTELIQCLSENRIRVTDFRTVLPNLEDVFLKLTGHSIRD